MTLRVVPEGLAAAVRRGGTIASRQAVLSNAGRGDTRMTRAYEANDVAHAVKWGG